MGREMARLFAAEGAKTVISDIQAEPLEETAAIVRDLGGETVSVHTDVSQREQVDRMVQTAVDSFGRVDILVNNAGYGYGATIEQTTEREFQELWETNVLSVLFGMQAVLPIMRRQGSGHIINVASAAGKIAYPGIGAYSATKHAIVALTDSLRAEVADAGIHASVVLPIGTRTKFFQAAHLAEGGSVGPHGPTQSAEHVARKIVACAKRPTPEVLPYKPLRLGIAIKSVMPSIMDAIGRRSFRHQTQRASDPTRMQTQEEAPMPPIREAPHGEA
ncbi:MAG: SDR family oxidoreductase [Chloroflexi bacterium]|nr:SDR family oxidoreductase [Chloroflexota bacterium]